MNKTGIYFPISRIGGYKRESNAKGPIDASRIVQNDLFVIDSELVKFCSQVFQKQEAK